MLKKTYGKAGHSCRVTFELSPHLGARNANLCGDFNAWDSACLPMRKRRDGGFVVTVSLKPGQQYRFRYLIDDHNWENDWDADDYVPNAVGGHDSLVIV